MQFIFCSFPFLLDAEFDIQIRNSATSEISIELLQLRATQILKRYQTQQRANSQTSLIGSTARDEQAKQPRNRENVGRETGCKFFRQDAGDVEENRRLNPILNSILDFTENPFCRHSI